jgi:predicted dehydrogenase
MSKPLGVAILGTGDVSGEHIKAFQRNSSTEVVAILSREVGRAERKAREHGLNHCRAYSDLGELLKNDSIHIVSICTPHHLHAEQGVRCAESGRHILVEKPVALDLESLHALAAAVRKAKVKSLASFVLRWNPLFETLRAILAQGMIGEVFYAETDYLHGLGRDYRGHSWVTTRAGGGSSILTGGCHAVDGLRWLAGKEACEVTAYLSSSKRNPNGYEYAPNSVTLVKFADGTAGKVTSSLECVMPYTFNILLMGDRGTIRNNQLFTSRWPGQTGWATIPTALPDSPSVSHHPFVGEINHLVDCITNDHESHCNLADTVKTHEICLATEISAREGRPVKLPLI